MNWIFSRFPDETVEITFDCRRKLGKHMGEIGDAMIYRLAVNRSSGLTQTIPFSAKRIVYNRFHLEIGYTKNIR
jgi:hypothetical protein